MSTGWLGNCLAKDCRRWASLKANAMTAFLICCGLDARDLYGHQRRSNDNRVNRQVLGTMTRSHYVIEAQSKVSHTSAYDYLVLNASPMQRPRKVKTVCCTRLVITTTHAPTCLDVHPISSLHIYFAPPSVHAYNDGHFLKPSIITTIK